MKLQEPEHPLYHLFSKEHVLIPIALESYVYKRPQLTLKYRFLFVFGLRIARWNVA